MRITKAKAVEIMRPVVGDKRFFSCDGGAWSTLVECAERMKSMPQEAFHRHCNGERCDFANWIGGVLGDEKLASDVKKCKSVRACVEKAIANRVTQLQKYL